VRCGEVAVRVNKVRVRGGCHLWLDRRSRNRSDLRGLEGDINGCSQSEMLAFYDVNSGGGPLKFGAR